MPSPQKNRTVHYSEISKKQIEEIKAQNDASRIQDVLNGAEWSIATNATMHSIIEPGWPVRVVKTDEYPGAPALRIYFQVVDGALRCDVLEVHVIEQSDEED